MTFEELEAFSVFARTLNFTKAAEELSISQPALHVKIQKLARILEVPLYRKEGRLLHLTPQGGQFARYCHEALAGRREFLESLHGRDYHPPVTLAAGAGSYLYLLGPAIRNFKGLSEAHLHLLTADRESCLELLRSGRADLGVTVLGGRPKDMNSVLLASIPCRFVCPKGHPLAERDSLSLSDLEGETLIVPPVGRPFRETLETYLKHRGVTWKLGLEAGGWELMMQFVALGLGCTLVNGCCRIPEACCSVSLLDFPPADYYLLSPKGACLSSTAEQVKQCLIESLQ